MHGRLDAVEKICVMGERRATMPQVPLFVSSSQAEGAVQNGSFNVRFQPPLRVPEGAVNTTMHIAHATLGGGAAIFQ